MSIEVLVDDSEFTELLKRVAAGIGNQPKAMERVKDALYQFILSPFRTTANAVDPWGDSWPQWSAATKYSRQHRNPPDYRVQMLVDSRALVSSILPTSDANSATVTAGGGEVDEYLYAQQFGTENAGRGGSVHIPARHFMPLKDEGDVDDFPPEWIAAFQPIIQEELNAYIEGLK